MAEHRATGQPRRLSPRGSYVHKNLENMRFTQPIPGSKNNRLRDTISNNLGKP